MKESYSIAIDTLFDLEGYKSNVKGDRGGRTIWGITERWWPKDVERMVAMTPKDSKEYAKNFYLKHFWTPHDLDNVPYPLDVVSFCMIVNSHVKGKELLKEALMDLHPTEVDWRDYLLSFMEFYQRIADKDPSQAKFRDGWFNRAFKLWNKFKEV